MASTTQYYAAPMQAAELMGGTVPPLVYGPPDFATRVHARVNAILGLDAQSEDELLRCVFAGLLPDVLDRLQQEGLRVAEMHFIIPPRTLSHRKSRNELLDVAESDRAVRVARILAIAELTFGDKQKALRWLRAPKKRFDQRTPLEMLLSELGARQVEDMLTRIDEGYFA